MAKGIGSGVISEHSVTFELHTGQKYGCDGEQTAVQVEHKLSVSNKPMLASMQSSQLVSEVVDDVDINDVDIDDVSIEESGPGMASYLQMLHCSWQLADESSSNKTVWHEKPKFISMKLLLNTEL